MTTEWTQERHEAAKARQHRIAELLAASANVYGSLDWDLLNGLYWKASVDLPDALAEIERLRAHVAVQSRYMREMWAAILGEDKTAVGTSHYRAMAMIEKLLKCERLWDVAVDAEGSQWADNIIAAEAAKKTT